MPSVELSAGTIEYADSGGDRPVVVLVGGLAIGPSLWDGVVAELGGGVRCIVPTLPWGAHRIPMHPDADLTMRGQAAILGEFLNALDLEDVTLVENDTAMAQVLWRPAATGSGGSSSPRARRSTTIPRACRARPSPSPRSCPAGSSSRSSNCGCTGSAAARSGSA